MARTAARAASSRSGRRLPVTVASLTSPLGAELHGDGDRALDAFFVGGCGVVGLDEGDDGRRLDDRERLALSGRRGVGRALLGRLVVGLCRWRVVGLCRWRVVGLGRWLGGRRLEAVVEGEGDRHRAFFGARRAEAHLADGGEGGFIEGLARALEHLDVGDGARLIELDEDLDRGAQALGEGFCGVLRLDVGDQARALDQREGLGRVLGVGRRQRQAQREAPGEQGTNPRGRRGYCSCS